jgi:alkanesulfonate monooxygenase SsuD/methylene tetrahydromethanopterin reductase-like flavin-dependent oxidoreductase (luciferase family)
MRIGVWLPNAMPFGLERGFFLDWVRLADEAGFDTLGTVDRPNYDMWDPLVSLAAAAAVTERIRLATTTLPLPNRNEVLVAKQAAVIDRLSEGRLTLGVSLGSRPDDYQVLGATLEHRVTRFRRQITTLRRVWAEARQSDREHGVLGPPPVQNPGPPIWIGALSERARQRAVELADGFIFGGAARPSTIGPAVASMRPQVAERGKTDFSFNAVAYGYRRRSAVASGVALSLPGRPDEGLSGSGPRSPQSSPRWDEDQFATRHRDLSFTKTSGLS